MKDHPRTVVWIIAAGVALLSALVSNCAPVDFDSSSAPVPPGGYLGNEYRSAPVYNTGSC